MDATGQDLFHFLRLIRRLRDLIEPLAASVYFAPEVHAAFEALGFGPSSGEFNGVQGPNTVAYVTSRGACMGQVPGDVITAAFGVFSPAAIVPAAEQGWAIASRDDILAARLAGQQAFLRRVLPSSDAELTRATELLTQASAGCQHAGRPLYAGLKSLMGPTGDAYGDLWKVADLVREHRGDCHTLAWASHGLSAAEIMLLTELWWGLPRRSYALTRGWTTEEYDRADARLADEGWVEDDQLTEFGRDLRRDIEETTDLLESDVFFALGDDVVELLSLLEPMADAIVAAGGYPRSAFKTESDLEVS